MGGPGGDLTPSNDPNFIGFANIPETEEEHKEPPNTQPDTGRNTNQDKDKNKHKRPHGCRLFLVK